MAGRFDPMEWSLNARRGVAAGVIGVVAIAVGSLLVFTADRGAGAANTGAVTTTSPGVVRSVSSTLPTLMSPAGVAQVAQPAPPVTAPVGSDTPPSGNTADVSVPAVIPLPFDRDQLAAAATVAVSWVGGISSVRYDEDQVARTTRLGAFLQNPTDPALRKWLAPTDAAIADLTTQQTVISSAAAVTKIATVTRSSVLFEVQVTQTTTQAGAAVGIPTPASYIVTVVPEGPSWKITALIGAADGDPGY